MSAALTVASACGAGVGSGSEKGVEGKTIEVGISGILSGPIAESANNNTGAIAFLKDINSKGGVNGYKFKWSEKDNANSSTQAAAVSRQLAGSSFVQIAVGTQAIIGVTPLADKLEVPIIGIGSGDYFTPDPDKFMFGVKPAYELTVNHDAAFLVKELGIKDIGFAALSGLPGAKTIPSYVESLGANFTTSVTVDGTSADYTAYAKQLQSSGAKGVVTLMSGTIMAGLQKAADAIGYKPTWIGMDLLADPSYRELAGPVAEDTYFDGFQLDPQGEDPSVVAYRDVVGKAYPKIVNSTSTQQGWTAAAVIAKAVEVATADGKDLTQDGFLKALSSLKDQQIGLIGSLTYDDQQHYGASTSGVFQWKGESFEQVADFQDISTFSSK